MVWTVSWVVAITFLISGCATRAAAGKVPAAREGRTFRENYRQAKQEAAAGLKTRATLSASAGYEKPYIPVVVPPRVERVWVPAHVSDQDPAVLVSGHWAYLMLEPAGWWALKEMETVQEAEGVLPRFNMKENNVPDAQ